jgi:hypothetical protein
MTSLVRVAGEQGDFEGNKKAEPHIRFGFCKKFSAV